MGQSDEWVFKDCVYSSGESKKRKENEVIVHFNCYTDLKTGTSSSKKIRVQRPTLPETLESASTEIEVISLDSDEGSSSSELDKLGEKDSVITIDPEVTIIEPTEAPAPPTLPTKTPPESPLGNSAPLPPTHPPPPKGQPPPPQSECDPPDSPAKEAPPPEFPSLEDSISIELANTEQPSLEDQQIDLTDSPTKAINGVEVVDVEWTR